MLSERLQGAEVLPSFLQQSWHFSLSRPLETRPSPFLYITGLIGWVQKAWEKQYTTLTGFFGLVQPPKPHAYTEMNSNGAQVNHTWSHLFQMVPGTVHLTVSRHVAEHSHCTNELYRRLEPCLGMVKTVSVSGPWYFTFCKAHFQGQKCCWMLWNWEEIKPPNIIYFLKAKIQENKMVAAEIFYVTCQHNGSSNRYF